MTLKYDYCSAFALYENTYQRVRCRGCGVLIEKDNICVSWFGRGGRTFHDTCFIRVLQYSIKMIEDRKIDRKVWEVNNDQIK